MKKPSNYSLTIQLSQIFKRKTDSKTEAGFTLIEILLVTAIIGILSSIVLIAINPQHRINEALDSQRKSDLAQMRNALEAYATGNHGVYPSTGGVFQCNDCGASDSPATTFSQNNWIPELVDKGFMKQLPHDPLNGQQLAGNCAAGSSYGYVYVSNGDDYKLMAYCSVKTNLNNDATQSTTASAYCSTSPPYDSTNFTESPSGVSKLKSLVDPKRPQSAYAVYSDGFICR